MTVTTSDLRSALNSLSVGRGYLPVHQCVRIVCDGSQVTVEASDGTTSVRAAMTQHDGDGFDVVVPRAPLIKFLSASRSGWIGMEPGQDLTVTAGRARIALARIEGDQWPRMEQPSGDPVTITDPDRLVRLCALASREDTRPILTGIRLDGQRAVATDSYRLGAMPLESPEALIPAVALSHALKDATRATLTIGERTASIEAHGVTTTTRLIEGEFPAWERLMEVSRVSALTVGSDDLLAALKTLGAIQTIAGTVVMEASDGQLTLRRSRPDMGDITDVIDCDGDCPRLAVNRGFLADMVKMAGTGSITLQITDDRKPIRCDAGDTTQILMPVRLS